MIGIKKKMRISSYKKRQKEKGNSKKKTDREQLAIDLNIEAF